MHGHTEHAVPSRAGTREFSEQPGGEHPLYLQRRFVPLVQHRLGPNQAPSLHDPGETLLGGLRKYDKGTADTGAAPNIVHS